MQSSLRQKRKKTSCRTFVMGSSGKHVARAMAKHQNLKVLLPFSFEKLRIPNDLAGHFDGAGGGGAGMPRSTALVVGASGKVWPVEAGRDGEGAFLGHGWPEFVAAHGISVGVGVGWFVVLRHEGRGVITVKAFDTSCCLNEFGRPLTVAATRRSAGGARRPQFMKVLLRGFMEKMLIPAEFVQRYISEEQLNSRTALFFGPLGKFWRIDVEKDLSDVIFAGGFSQFVEFHGITESDALLLRYEGNMLFTVKVFGPNGCQKGFKEQEDTRFQQTEQSEETEFEELKNQQEAASSSRKRKSKNERPCGEQKRKQKSSRTSLNKEPSQKKSVFEIGLTSWIKKEINAYALERHLPLTTTFCDAIGFRKHCTITLKTSMDSSARSWQVRGLAYSNGGGHQLGHGWRSFCKENGLEEGDVCTFNVVETTLWHVVIARRGDRRATKW